MSQFIDVDLIAPPVTDPAEAAVYSNPDDPATRLAWAELLQSRGESDLALLHKLLAASKYDLAQVIREHHGWTSEALPDQDIGRAASPLSLYDDSPAARVRLAAHLVNTFSAARPHYAALDAKARRKLALLDRANAGDGRALLAHPGARKALWQLVDGTGGGVTIYVSSRKAIREAKALLLDRQRRRRHRAAAERARHQPVGRVHARWIAKLKSLAVGMAERYHRGVKSLYRSSRACVEYGHGGREDTNYCYRGAWKGTPARWRNAGARLDNEVKPTAVIIENHLGNVVATLPLPREGR